MLNVNLNSQASLYSNESQPLLPTEINQELQVHNRAKQAEWINTQKEWLEFWEEVEEPKKEYEDLTFHPNNSNSKELIALRETVIKYVTTSIEEVKRYTDYSNPSYADNLQKKAEEVLDTCDPYRTNLYSGGLIYQYQKGNLTEQQSWIQKHQEILAGWKRIYGRAEEELAEWDTSSFPHPEVHITLKEYVNILEKKINFITETIKEVEQYTDLSLKNYCQNLEKKTEEVANAYDGYIDLLLDSYLNRAKQTKL